MVKNNVLVQESTAYENCIGQKEADQKMITLSDFMEIGDVEEQENDFTDKEWKKHWKGMPEYEQEDNPSYKKIYVSFRNEEDYQEFAKLIDQNLSIKTKSIWYPKLDREANSLLRWIEEDDQS
jgi:hypothetical protein